MRRIAFSAGKVMMRMDARWSRWLVGCLMMPGNTLARRSSLSSPLLRHQHAKNCLLHRLPLLSEGGKEGDRAAAAAPAAELHLLLLPLILLKLQPGHRQLHGVGLTRFCLTRFTNFRGHLGPQT